MNSSAGERPATVGVVVPTYNRARLVIDTLDSVLAQTLPPHRLIVVDDGSNDGSPETVKRWRARTKTDIDIRCVSLVNGGVSRARNRGLALLSDCEFVICLDSDDCLPKDFLMRTSRALAAAPNAVAASVEQLYGETGECLPPPDSEKIKPLRWMFVHGAGILSSTLLRRRPLLEIGGFDECLLTGQDSDTLIRLSLQGDWLALPGEPVKMRRDRRDAGETQHLHKRGFDSRRRWAQLHQRLWEQQSEIRQCKGVRTCRWALGRHWTVAGTLLYHQRNVYYLGLPWHFAWRDIIACLLASMRWDRRQMPASIAIFLGRRIIPGRRVD